MSRFRVNQSLKWSFIKVVMTKNQEKEKRDKERVESLKEQIY